MSVSYNNKTVKVNDTLSFIHWIFYIVLHHFIEIIHDSLIKNYHYLILYYK